MGLCGEEVQRATNSIWLNIRRKVACRLYVYITTHDLLIDDMLTLRQLS